MEPLDTQSLPFSIEVSRGRFRNSRSKRPQRNETTSRNEDAKEIPPENRSRQGPEIGANPDGAGILFLLIRAYCNAQKRKVMEKYQRNKF